MRRRIDVFVHGHSHVRSASYPCVPFWENEMWVMRDDPPRKKPRKIEVVAYGLEPEQVVSRLDGMGWHFVSHIHADAEFDEIRTQYKALGMRAMSTEGFFVHRLLDIPVLEAEIPVRLVDSEEVLNSIPNHASQPRKLKEGRETYCIWDENSDYGWVDLVPSKGSAWIANLYTHDFARGRGYGRALMSTVIRRAKELGLEEVVLLGTAAGSRLYPHLGFERIGTLQIFCPLRRH